MAELVHNPTKTALLAFGLIIHHNRSLRAVVVCLNTQTFLVKLSGNF